MKMKTDEKTNIKAKDVVAISDEEIKEKSATTTITVTSVTTMSDTTTTAIPTEYITGGHRILFTLDADLSR